jgi:GGDEF domain-containing protein
MGVSYWHTTTTYQKGIPAMNYDDMTREELIAMVEKLTIDSAFGIINRNAAELSYSTIESGKQLIMFDIANMHGANHKYTMAGVDTMIRTLINEFRHSDILIRWGGDEIVILLNSGCALEYIDRFDTVARANNLYGVYGIVTTSNSLVESVARADALVMQVKLCLELNGMKTSRDQEYSLLDSHVVNE